ncbi:hypothetical protein HDU91_002288 [Kappamyces sp. JEL0680]|nr:hypothetical protein HDU91_002288 [Kappamyces sp. JEL0680]
MAGILNRKSSVSSSSTSARNSISQQIKKPFEALAKTLGLAKPKRSAPNTSETTLGSSFSLGLQSGKPSLTDQLSATPNEWAADGHDGALLGSSADRTSCIQMEPIASFPHVRITNEAEHRLLQHAPTVELSDLHRTASASTDSLLFEGRRAGVYIPGASAREQPHPWDTPFDSMISHLNDAYKVSDPLLQVPGTSGDRLDSIVQDLKSNILDS